MSWSKNEAVCQGGRPQVKDETRMPGVGVVGIQSQPLPLAPQSQRSENFSKRLQSPVCIVFVVPGAIS